MLHVHITASHGHVRSSVSPSGATPHTDAPRFGCFCHLPARSIRAFRKLAVMNEATMYIFGTSFYGHVLIVSISWVNSQEQSPQVHSQAVGAGDLLA